MSKSSRPGREALYLGRLDRPGRRRWVRDAPDGLPAADEAVRFADGQTPHLLTIAPSESGRDRSCLIPNLMNYPGQVMVLDIDGKAYAATAEARWSMGGQGVERLDPFGVTGPESGAFSPLDWIDWRDESTFETDLAAGCQEIADLLSPGNSFGGAAGQEAIRLLGAIIGYLYAIPERHIEDLYDTLHGDDPVYSLAVVLDTLGKKIPPTAYLDIASFLETDERTRTRILAAAAATVKDLGSPEARKSLHESTFTFPPEPPATVYLIIPAERLAAGAALARLWIGTFLRRAAKAKPSVPLLFLLDHCSALGPLPVLESLHTMTPEGALRIWTFWDDVHQLRVTYPRGWPAMLAGCGAVQVFGTSDPEAAAEAAAVLGLPADDIRSLGPADQIVRLDGVPSRLRRLGEPDMTSRAH